MVVYYHWWFVCSSAREIKLDSSLVTAVPKPQSEQKRRHVLELAQQKGGDETSTFREGARARRRALILFFGSRCVAAIK